MHHITNMRALNSARLCGLRLSSYRIWYRLWVSGFRHFEGTRFLYLQLYIFETWTQCFHLQRSRSDRCIWKQYISSNLQRNITLWLRIMFNTNWVPRLWIDKSKFKKGNIYLVNICVRRSHWPRGLRRRSSAACLLRLWVLIPPVAWMFVCCWLILFSLVFHFILNSYICLFFVFLALQPIMFVFSQPGSGL
jgi:hypothetical protein